MNNPTPKKVAPDFEAVIPGRPIVKKNTQRAVKLGGFARIIYSDRFKQYERTALSILKQMRLRRDSTLMGALHASYTFHFKNRQGEADVSNLCEAPGDVLEKSGIIENDKQIVSLDAQKIFSGEEKTIIELWRLECANSK